MDAAAKKHALRLVPYGLYLAGTRREDGTKQVSLVSWFTQTSFDPCLVVVGMHREGAAFAAVQETGVMALNILGEDNAETLKGFYKHVDVADDKAGALEVTYGETDCPMLPALPATVELKLVEVTEGGDHAACIFEVIEAHVHDDSKKALSHEACGLHYAG